MTRGQRAGVVTSAELRRRLSAFAADHERRSGVTLALPPSSAAAARLLGHAKFHGLVTADEYDETRPRKETTIPCYLKTHVGHLPPGSDAVLERYVQVASRLFYRGGVIANLVAIQAVGDSDGIPGSSPRFGVARALSVAPSMLDLLLEDAKSSTFKHVFLPERWPSSKEPRNALVHAVLAAHGDVLPAAPEFLDVMKATGWDNVVNRMASKFSGNLKVLVTCGLRKRAKTYLETYSALDADRDGRKVLVDMLTGRLRPLAVSCADFESVLELRAVLGVSEATPQWMLDGSGDGRPSAPHASPLTLRPPERAEWSRTTLAAHLFIVRHSGADDAYLPVVSRGRKYSYVDAKVAAPLFGACLPRDVMGDGKTRSVGDLLKLTPDAFNARCKDLRKAVRRRLKQRLVNERRPKRRARLRERARSRLGYGVMPAAGRVDSLETDGVGLRLCVKVPTDMSGLVVPLPTAQETGGEKPAKRRRRCAASDAPTAAPDGPPPIFAAADEGRAKLATFAVWKPTPPAMSYPGMTADAWVRKKPSTVTLTRKGYYRTMGYFRHRSWSREQQQRPAIAAVLASLSKAGGVRRSRLSEVVGALAVEKAHEAELDAEYVQRRDYAVWRMRLFRGKRRALDGGASSVVKACVEGQPLDRPLVVGVGSASFPATMKGALSAPTTSLHRALKRRLDQLRARTGRTVIQEWIWEHRTTLCCCQCCAVTQAPLVDVRDKQGGRAVAAVREDGTPERRRSRRLRLCADCAATAGERRRRPARDRDVQASRNILWALVHQYYGAPRPEYLCRR